MFLGVSQHAEFIFDVRFGQRRRQMGYPEDTPLPRCVTPLSRCVTLLLLCVTLSRQVSLRSHLALKAFYLFIYLRGHFVYNKQSCWLGAFPQSKYLAQPNTGKTIPTPA